MTPLYSQKEISSPEMERKKQDEAGTNTKGITHSNGTVSLYIISCDSTVAGLGRNCAGEVKKERKKQSCNSPLER